MIKDQESYKIIGAAMEVHNQLGAGFTEFVYQDALEQEFKLRNIPYEREKELQVVYKGNVLSHSFIPDFICYGSIIVELKAVSDIIPAFEAQIINYMKISKYELGLLFNFAKSELDFKRYINK